MISFPKCTKYISSGEIFLFSQLYLSNTAMGFKKNFVLEITMLNLHVHITRCIKEIKVVITSIVKHAFYSECSSALYIIIRRL